MATSTVTPEADAKKRTRSPAYPFINLETAIRRAREFYGKMQHHEAPVKVAVKLWKYEEKSSGGLQTAAAMVSFGLLSDQGTGDKRKLQLTQLALKILLNPDESAKQEAIKEAALTPKIHRQVWKKWGAKPPEAAMRYALLADWEPKFNPNTVDSFIREYRDTIAFAKLTESDTLTVEVEDKDKANGENEGEASNKSFPVNDLASQAKPEVAKPTVNALSGKSTMREDVFSLTEGKVTIQWPTPLSAESITDLKDWLKIVERKIARSTVTEDQAKED